VASLLGFHQGWAWVVIVGNGLAGLWALAAHRVPSLRTRALWWFTGGAEVAVAVQVATGVAMVTANHARPVPFHPFYGYVAVVVIGFLFAYRSQLWRRRYQLYGWGGLFLMGVAIRALLVARS